MQFNAFYLFFFFFGFWPRTLSLTNKVVTRVFVGRDVQLAVRLALHEVSRGSEHGVELHHLLDDLGCSVAGHDTARQDAKGRHGYSQAQVQAPASQKQRGHRIQLRSFLFARTPALLFLRERRAQPFNFLSRKNNNTHKKKRGQRQHGRIEKPQHQHHTTNKLTEPPIKPNTKKKTASLLHKQNKNKKRALSLKETLGVVFAFNRAVSILYI